MFCQSPPRPRQSNSLSSMVFRGGNDRGRIEKTYYRSFQAVFNIGARFLVWRRPIPFSGVGSIRKIPELLKKEKVNKVMVVTGPTVGKKLAPKILAELEKAGIAYELFAEVEANPSVNRIQKLYLEKSCEGSIAIGGGSPMDAGEGSRYPCRAAVRAARKTGLLPVIKKLLRRV